MNLICIRKNLSDFSDESLLRFVLSNRPIAGFVMDELGRFLYPHDNNISIPEHFERLQIGKTVYAIPEEWRIDSSSLQDPSQKRQRSFPKGPPEIIYYGEDVLVPFVQENISRGDEVEKPWFVLSNGRFAAKIDIGLLEKILLSIEANVVAVTADPNLLGEGEEVRLTTEGKVAAFHRLYKDSAEFTFASTNWPHYLFIRTCVLERVLPGGVLPLSFSTGRRDWPYTPST